MEGYTNCSSSSSVQFNQSIINITWTPGATCSITNGLTTLIAPNTSGNYQFKVPDGVWKIMCSNGTHTTTQVINLSRNVYKSITMPDPAVYMIWNGYDTITQPLPQSGGNAGGFIALKGTVNTQTDTLTLNDTTYEGRYSIHYFENNNDYGGIRTANKISFANYSKLHLEIPRLDSWQDSNYYASVIIGTTAYTATNNSGYITSYSYSNVIDSRTGESSIHIQDQSYNLELNLSNYNDDYYIYILVARGDSVPVSGQLYISKIWLTET